jgi:hypothetical protein
VCGPAARLCDRRRCRAAFAPHRIPAVTHTWCSANRFSRSRRRIPATRPDSRRACRAPRSAAWARVRRRRRGVRPAAVAASGRAAHLLAAPVPEPPPSDRCRRSARDAPPGRADARARGSPRQDELSPLTAETATSPPSPSPEPSGYARLRRCGASAAALVRRAAQPHNGALRRRPGAGTRFLMALPRDAEHRGQKHGGTDPRARH